MSHKPVKPKRVVLFTLLALVYLSVATAAEEQIDFAIPATKLSNALALFALQSGRELVYLPKIAANKRSAALTGGFSVAQGLQTLLRGSELGFRFSASGTILIELLKLDEPTASAASTAGATIEEVIVNARKKHETDQSIPVSMSTSSAIVLRERHITAFEDLRRLSPNLNIQPYQHDNQTFTMAMRGQRQQGVQLTLDQSVGVYLDGSYYARPMGLASALIDAARVEVLRGPQGTLYGRNTTGGAIAIYSSNPSRDAEATLKFELGNYRARELTAIVNLPFGDNSGLRLVSSRQYRDGYAKSQTGRDIDDLASEYYRLKFKSDISDQVTLSVFGAYTHSENNGPRTELRGVNPKGYAVQQAAAELAGIDYWQPGQDALLNPFIAIALKQYQQWIDNDYSTMATNIVPESSYEDSQLIIEIDATVANGLDLKSISAIHDFKRDALADYDGSPFQIMSIRGRYDDQHISQEFQLLGDSDRLAWVAGAYYSQEHGDGYNSPRPVLPAITGPRRDFESLHRVENHSYAGFAQADLQLTERLRLTLGARYSVDQRAINISNTAANRCLVPAPGVASALTGASQCPRRFDKTFSSPSWLASVDYRFTTATMAFAKVSTGYRSGGWNQNGQVLAETFESFDPERLTEYELGLKSQLFSDQLRLNIAAFYSNYRDIQRVVIVPTEVGSIATRNDNAASASLNGLEADIVWRPNTHFELTFSSGYTDAQFDEYRVQGVDRSREAFAIPRVTSGLTLRTQTHTGIGLLTLYLDYYRQSEINFARLDEAPELSTQAAYGLVNGRISLAWPAQGFELALFARNLTDKQYFVEANNVYADIGLVSVQPGQPRLWGLQFTKWWGARSD